MCKLFNLFIIPILCFLFAFGSPISAASTSTTTSTVFLPFQQKTQPFSVEPQLVVQEMINQVDRAQALTDLRRLTGIEPICMSKGCTTISSRFTGSQNLQTAKDYVYETLVSLQYKVEVLNWSDSGLSDQDILAHKQGIRYPDQEVYFIAHLDGYPQNGPGADDDGTGAVALLELARIMANMHPSYSVTLFFSTGEEQGSVGSSWFVKHYPDRLPKIKYLVSVEMLGYDSNNDYKMELWSGDQNTDFQQLLSNMITAYPSSINLIPQIYTGCT